MSFRQYGNNVGSTELDDVDDKNEDQAYDGMYAGNDGNNGGNCGDNGDGNDNNGHDHYDWMHLAFQTEW